MFRKLITTFAPLAAAALLIALPTLAVAHSGEQEQEHMHGDMHGESNAMMDCQQMMMMNEQMQDEREQMQAELDEMVAHMNTVSGKAQQHVIAELLTKLVENSGTIRGMMTKIQPMMMGHMMQHMAAGEMGDMSDCPMMKSMQGDNSGAKSDGNGEHSAHH